MEETLDFLEELIDEYTKQRICFSEDRLGAVPKAGKEKEWEESQRKVDKLFMVAKIVHARKFSLTADKKEKFAIILERILDKSATAYVRNYDGVTEICILDELTRNTLAVFRVEISSSLHAIFVTDYQFCQSQHIGKCCREVSCRILQSGKCPGRL